MKGAVLVFPYAISLALVLIAFEALAELMILAHVVEVLR